MSADSATEDRRLNQALDQLRSVLVSGETLEAWAVQRRIFALTHRRILIAATSGRFIALERKLFGGFDMVDFRWQDLHDAKLRAGILSADVSFGTSGISDLAMGSPVPRNHTYTGLRREQAQQVYRIGQAQDQGWREKRRIRELEELRAKSGGFQFAESTAASSAASAAPQQRGDAVSRLQQAKQMLDAKLISDSEYESIKARIISGV